MRYAVVLAGGSGTRLWPLSRAERPKQLIPLAGGRSLLELALARLEGLVEPSRQYVCTGERYRAAIRAALPALTDEQILGEPEGRDTLAAVGLPAALLARQDPDAVIAVFTADHVLEPIEIFQRRIAAGFALVERAENWLVTFGIQPTCPATGYGYVELGAAIAGAEAAYHTIRFVEKPDAATAASYLAAGNYAWNSGMFVWRATTLLDCIARYKPAVHAGLQKIAANWDGPKRAATLARIYPTLERISVDYAVMEPASRDPRFQIATVALPVNWLDVGGWSAYAETVPADAQGNRATGCPTALVDSQNNLIVGEGDQHLVAALGVHDLVIVHSAKATLICRRADAERVKALQALLPDEYR